MGQPLPNPEQIGSVAFTLDGPIQVSRVENIAPYALFGNDPFDFEDYLGQQLPAGEYSLEVTPYSEPRQGGEAGETAEISFRVVGGSSLLAYPNPSEEGNIQLKAPEGSTIQVFDSQGNLLLETILKSKQALPLTLNPGLYLVRQINQGHIEEQKVMIK